MSKAPAPSAITTPVTSNTESSPPPTAQYTVIHDSQCFRLTTRDSPVCRPFQSAYKGLTVAQAIAKWAPPNENDTTSYINNICGWTGLPADKLIDDCL